MSRLRIGIATLLLGAQLGAITYARFVETRYFCWAPFHHEATYTLEVHVGQRSLSEAEALARYRIISFYRDRQSGRHWELNTIEHIKETIRQFEQNRSDSTPAEVRLSYSINGAADEEWRWPKR